MQTDLAPKTTLAERYLIERTLGRGGFAITYLAVDTLANREVVLKELCPPGSIRTEDSLQLPEGSERAAYQFLREARTLARLRLDGVINVLDAFQERGTAYVAMEYLPEAIPLERVLRAEGPFSQDRTVVLIGRLCDILDGVHERGFLHRDVKPSNILLGKDDQPYLIDFGAAREWHADATVQHTTLFTPGYAPIEQLSEKGRRSPATDVYSLAATGYELLAGMPPISAIDRLAGTPVAPIPKDIDPTIASAIMRGLAMKASDRPQTASAFKALLVYKEPTHAVTRISPLEQMDEALAQLRDLRVKKNECPSCGELLAEIRPLRSGKCPNCRTGKLSKRQLETHKCAICRTGYVKHIQNDPLAYCPICCFGKLTRPGLLKRGPVTCQSCDAVFSIPERGKLRLDAVGSKNTALADIGDIGDEHDFWLDISRRSTECAECEACGAQWDMEQSGAMRLVFFKEDPYHLAKKHRSLYQEEWSRLAAKLAIDAGNFVCEACDADFFIDDESATLIDASTDAFGFAAGHQGRRIPLESLPWVGAGKNSGSDGPICDSCETEFDFDGDYLRLRYSANPNLARLTDEVRTVDDWHRIARGLPQVAHEIEYRESFMRELRQALLAGEIAWHKEDALFAAHASQVEDGQTTGKGELVVDRNRIELKTKRNGLSAPLDAIADCSAHENKLTVALSGEPRPITFEIDPARLEVEMQSGRYEVLLNAEDAMEAIANGLELRRPNAQVGRHFV